MKFFYIFRELKPNSVSLKKQYFFLILFVAFLCTPAIVYVIQGGKQDYALSCSEDEKQVDPVCDNENDVQIKQDFELFVLPVVEVQQNAGYRYLSQMGIVYLDPVYPPPKFS